MQSLMGSASESSPIPIKGEELARPLNAAIFWFKIVVRGRFRAGV
jgi:hypothetical protein